MRAREFITESSVSKAMSYKRSNRYPDGKDIPESLPDRYQPASNPGVPKNQKCSNCSYYDTDTKKCSKFKGDPVVRPAYWCAKWELYKEEVTEAHGNSKIYDKCWDGYKKVPGKKRGEKGSCKKIGEDVGLSEEFDLIENVIEQIAIQNNVDSDAVWEDLETLSDDELYVFAVTQPVLEDWQKVNKKDKTDGMSKKAVNAYRRENPGSKLKTAVTTKPSKLKKGSKASKRRKSYCSRSAGQKKMHNIDCTKTPDKAICKARRRWNC